MTSHAFNMLVAPKLTPEVLIEAPRRGPAVPNHDGSQAIFTCSTHTIGGGTLKEVRLLHIKSGESGQLLDSPKVHDVTWLGDETNAVVYLESGEKGVTLMKVLDWNGDSKDTYVVEEFPAPVSTLKLKLLEDGSIALALVGRVDENGDLFNEETEEKTATARVYASFRFRYWDTYLKPQKYTMWFSRLVKSSESGKYSLTGPLRNLLVGTDIEAPYGINNGLADSSTAFDLSDRGIIFTAEDPENKDPNFKGITSVYYVPLESWDDANVLAAPRVLPVLSDSSKAFYSNPRFSPDGSTIAFLRNSVNRFQDSRIFITHLRGDINSAAVDVGVMVTGRSDWDLVPDGFEFASSGHSLFITANDCARVALYELKLQPNATPKLLFKEGSVSAYYPLTSKSSDRLLVTNTSLVESSAYQIVDISGTSDVFVVSSATKNGIKLGLSPKQVSEIYFEGAGDYCVQAWVIKPKDFDESKKYPLALLVHGGPESSWNDAWSTRWNQATWAEQGYVVVAPNPTGSVGFGLDHTERIYGSWGGRPYEDLVNCIEYLKDIPYLDLDNAVMAGGSYGGYMANWIQGNPLGRKFKAIVCHDGIFHLPAFMLQTDETAGLEDFHGPPYIWNNLKNLDKYNPARPDLLKNWKTPMLIIHSDKDFRCPVTEGIAAYNTCQTLGVESRFLNFPDENHFVLKEENSLVWHREVFGWINKYSGVGKGQEEEAEAEATGR